MCPESKYKSSTKRLRNAGSASSPVLRSEWTTFLKEFGESHRGWFTVLETNDHITQETVTSQDTLLQSIELDVEDEKNPRINVLVRMDNKIIKHILFQPTHVVLRASSNGQECLEIETLNTTTRVYVRPHSELPVI